MGVLTYVVQVANLAITTKEDDIRHMFGYIGRIDEIQMYPRNVSLMPVPTKVAFIKFRHRRDAAVSLHLTNSILVDKLIQVIPWREDEMPTEAVALQSLFPGQTMGGSFGVQPPRLEQIMAEADLPPPPTIPSSVDSDIRDQIQRTVHVKGLNPQTTNVSEVLEHFQAHAGEVKYVTLAGEGDFVEDCDAYVEFGTIYGVVGALKMKELSIKEKEFTVECARCAILKSTLKPKTAADSAVEIAEALKASKDGRLPSDYYGEPTGNLDPAEQAALDEKRRERKEKEKKEKEEKRSKRSRSRKRSKSRKRSRSKKRSRSRDRERRRRSRSGSRSKKSKRSRRSRSRDRKNRDRKRSKSRDKEREKDVKSEKMDETEQSTEQMPPLVTANDSADKQNE
jgi:arginine/serine-rich splicing factor 12